MSVHLILSLPNFNAFLPRVPCIFLFGLGRLPDDVHLQSQLANCHIFVLPIRPLCRGGGDILLAVL